MELKAGYKNTEIGVIPEDWNDYMFQDVLEGFSSGMTPYRAIQEYYSGDIPWVTSGELNYNTITDTFEKITKQAVENTNLKILPIGTFLMAITGLEAAGTRGSCGITGIKATTNQSCMALFPQKGKIITEYLYHFYVKYGNELAIKFCQGTKQQSYTGKIAKILPINLPTTLEEQSAIATVLSDTDSLIQALEKKIAKKQLIKKGAMQKLLSPKEGWVVKTLGEIGKTYGGLSGKSKSDFSNGNSKYIPFMNIMSNPIIDKEYLDCVFIKPNEIQNKALKGDLFFNGSSETPEEVGLCSALLTKISNLYLNSFCFGFRLFKMKEMNSLYLSYFFRSPIGRELFYSLAQGATRYNLSKANFLKMEIKLPCIQEQTHIAQILSDMDNEIESLQKKLAKYHQLKLGLMQSLLTGKIRLV